MNHILGSKTYQGTFLNISDLDCVAEETMQKHDNDHNKNKIIHILQKKIHFHTKNISNLN